MLTKAAKRYAAALYASASQQGLAREIGRELEELATLWQTSPELGLTMQNPRLARSGKAELLETVAAKFELSPLIKNLNALLLDKGRLELLPALSREYGELEDKAQGLARARCLVAHPLSQEQAQRLRQSLVKISGAREVILTLTVDPSLLAGFVVNLEGKLIDGSLKGRLQRLGRSLAL